MSQRRLVERVFHAVGFELIATAICAPVAAWVMHRPVLEMGALTLILASGAMVWNIIYNLLFDHWWPASKVVRSARVRVLHALGFEGGFIIIGSGLAAAWLGVSVVQAFMLELGFFAFFLPYTVVYNWCYDGVRARLVAHRAAQQARALS